MAFASDLILRYPVHELAKTIELPPSAFAVVRTLEREFRIGVQVRPGYWKVSLHKSRNPKKVEDMVREIQQGQRSIKTLDSKVYLARLP